MASQADRDLGLDEQIARIQKMNTDLGKAQVEIQKITQDIKLATPQMYFQGMLASVAVIGAGAALTKLLF